MSAKQASVHAKWIIGRVIGTKMLKTAKVRVTRLVLDPYLLKVITQPCFSYFNNQTGAGSLAPQVDHSTQLCFSRFNIEVV
jgi:hypothetical protein